MDVEQDVGFWNCPHRTTYLVQRLFFKWRTMRNMRLYKEMFTQPEIKCLKLTIETLEKGVKYVQS